MWLLLFGVSSSRCRLRLRCTVQNHPYLQIGTAKDRRHEAVSILCLFLAAPGWVAMNMFSNINISKLISKFCDRLSNLPVNAVE